MKKVSFTNQFVGRLYETSFMLNRRLTQPPYNFARKNKIGRCPLNAQHLPIETSILVYSCTWCSLDLAPLTTSLRPRNSLSCNSSTARFASSIVCMDTKANPLERWLCR